MTEHGSFGSKSADPQPPSSVPFPKGGGPSTKKHPSGYRSGYQRSKARLARVNADLDDARLENSRLREELADLEALFQELKKLNESLAADLRKLKQRPAPTFANVLMGARHG